MTNLSTPLSYFNYSAITTSEEELSLVYKIVDEGYSETYLFIVREKK